MVSVISCLGDLPRAIAEELENLCQPETEQAQRLVLARMRKAPALGRQAPDRVAEFGVVHGV